MKKITVLVLLAFFGSIGPTLATPAPEEIRMPPLAFFGTKISEFQGWIATTLYVSGPNSETRILVVDPKGDLDVRELPGRSAGARFLTNGPGAEPNLFVYGSRADVWVAEVQDLRGSVSWSSESLPKEWVEDCQSFDIAGDWWWILQPSGPDHAQIMRGHLYNAVEPMEIRIPLPEWRDTTNRARLDFPRLAADPDGTTWLILGDDLYQIAAQDGAWKKTGRRNVTDLTEMPTGTQFHQSPPPAAQLPDPVPVTGALPPPGFPTLERPTGRPSGRALGPFRIEREEAADATIFRVTRER